MQNPRVVSILINLCCRHHQFCFYQISLTDIVRYCCYYQKWQGWEFLKIVHQRSVLGGYYDPLHQSLLQMWRCEIWFWAGISRKFIQSPINSAPIQIPTPNRQDISSGSMHQGSGPRFLRMKAQICFKSLDFFRYYICVNRHKDKSTLWD